MNGRIAVLLLTLAIVGGCSGIWFRPNGPEDVDPPPWTYDAPATWAQTYPQCAAANQSPINITSAQTQAAPPLRFLFEPIDGRAVDTLSTIRVIPEGGTLQIDDQNLTLREIVFHVPSEHRIEGEAFAAEMQLMFLGGDSERVAVGVLIAQGEENDFVEEVIEQLNGERDEVELEDVLPEELSYYTYTGSLTMPPCTGNVTWFVLQNPLEVAPAQVDSLARRHSGNVRPLQPLNNRPILRSE